MSLMNLMNITRALSDENRVRILMALRNREFCVCQITAFLDLSPSTTSKHLSVLKQARLVEGKKEGKWVYYRLADLPESFPMAKEAIAWLTHSIADSTAVRKDDDRIRQILEEEKTRYGIDGCKVPDEFHSVAVHAVAPND